MTEQEHSGKKYPAFVFPAATKENIWPAFEVRNAMTADDMSELITFIRKEHNGTYYLIPMRYLLAAPRGFGAVANFKLVTKSVHYVQHFYKLDDERNAEHARIDPDQRPEAERLKESERQYPPAKQ